VRALITGANGTIGRVLATQLLGRGDEVVRWDRRSVPLDDYAAMERFVREAGVDTVFHLAIASQPTGREHESWTVNYHWTGELAWICRTLGLRMVFASTAMVFSDAARGPFTVDSIPDASVGYGYEKRMAEARVAYQYPDAVVARLGWQIGDLRSDGPLVDPGAGSNTMESFLARQHRDHGEIRASTRWLPACSFVDDTAAALHELAGRAGGTYLLDSNRRWTFFSIARALSTARRAPWSVLPTEDFIYDQRMIDDRIALPALESRLSALGVAADGVA
jgi:dTDP-4-dehydrorhamnose reductase